MDSKSGKGLYCGLEAFNSQLHEQVLFFFFFSTNSLPVFQNYHWKFACCLSKIERLQLITAKGAPQIPGIGVWGLGAAGPGGILPMEEAAVPLMQLWLLMGSACSSQETLCDTTRLWALAAPIKDSWAPEQRGASGTMVLITRFIFFLPLLLIWDVWVFLPLALFGFARCFEAEMLLGKGQFSNGAGVVWTF